MSGTCQKFKSIYGLLTAFLLICPANQSFSRGDKTSKETNGKLPVVVVDASDLIDHMAREHVFMDNSRFGRAWLFNNSAIELTERPTMQGSVNLQTRVNIPESGEYQIFVRSAGPSGSSLRVAVGEQITASVQCDSTVTWKHAGSMDLLKGEETVCRASTA